MKEELFSIWDGAARRFLSCWTAPTIEVALRRFRVAVNTHDSDFGRFPEDYTLFHVGTFDQEQGAIVPTAAPVNLGVAVTLVERPTMVAPDIDEDGMVVFDVEDAKNA